MKKFKLQDYYLFKGITNDELRTLLPCIDAKVIFLKEGKDITELIKSGEFCFLILSGNILIQGTNVDGVFKENDIAGVSYIDKEFEDIIESYMTITLVTLLRMKWSGIMRACWFSCFFHNQLVQNIENKLENQKNIVLGQNL